MPIKFKKKTFLFNIINKFWGQRSVSKMIAKERLRLVLIQDRSYLSPQTFQNLKNDLISVISQYMEVDENMLEISLNSNDEMLALTASIPVKQMNRGGKAYGEGC